MANNYAFGIGSLVVSGGTQTQALSNLTFDNSPTVTFGLNGAVITASAAGGGGGGGSFSAGGSNLGNTLGNTGTVSNQLVLAGINGITLSQSTNAGGATITFSGITQSVQTQDQLSVGVSTGGNTAGNTTVNTGNRLVFVGSNMISISQATGAGSTTLQFSATQSVQTQGITGDQLSLGLSNLGNTQGNTTVNSGNRFVLVGTNGITLSQATGAGSTTISISGNAAQTVQTQGITGDQLSIGVSTGGNTEGNTTVQSGNRIVFVGSNMITISQATGAGSTTMTIKATQSNQVITMFANSNTTQSSTGTANASSLNFVGAGIASVGITGGSVVISVPAGGGAGDGGVFAGVSTDGNTAGSTGTVSTGNFVLVGSNITLSQSTGAAGSNATVTIIGPTQQTRSGYNEINWATFSVLQAGNGFEIFTNLDVKENLSISRLDQWISLSISTSTNSSHAGNISFRVGIYTLNGVTLSLASSGSQTYQWSNTSNNSTSVLSGFKQLSIPIDAFMTPGQYWIGFMSNTSTTNANWFTASNIVPGGPVSSISGFLLSATNTSMQRYPFNGAFSASSTNLIATLSSQQISMSGTIWRAVAPLFNMRNF